jgi:hypothetical protein
VLAVPTAVSGAFMVLIRLGFLYLPCPADAGEAVPRGGLVHIAPQRSRCGTVTV